MTSETNNYTSINNPYRNNPLMSPLFKFNDRMGVTFTKLPADGPGREVLKRIGFVIIAPFAYLALAFTALIGYCFDSLLRREIKPQQSETPIENKPPKGTKPSKPVDPPKEISNVPLVPIPVREKPAKSRISHLELKAQEGEESKFKGFDLMMKSDHIEEALRKDYDNNPKVMILSTVDPDLVDHLLDANVEEDGYMQESNKKGDPKYILIPILENHHYTGFFINHEKKKFFVTALLGIKKLLLCGIELKNI